MEVFRAPRVSLIARPEFLEPEHLRVQWQGSASAGERLAEFAGRICYMSQHNPANRSTADYLENIKKQGHGSVLEHAVYVLLIEGISRSCSHELVRHRAGFGYSQLSQRYVDESHAAFVMPPAILGDAQLEAEWQAEVADAQAAYVRAVEALMQRYEWVSDKVHRRKMAREAARSVLPNATEVKIVVSGNARAWRTMLELRAGEGAELEIRRMAVAWLQVLQREAPATITAVEQALGLFGAVIRLEADQFLPQKLALSRPDLVFNMAEGFRGQSREALVPAICEYLSIPYTGSDPLTLALSLHKGRTKETLAFRGVPTAPFACLETPDDLDRLALPFPVFVKPIAEGSGKGVFSNNLCDGPRALAERVRFLTERYAEPVLVETYLPGPEFTVAILGNGPEAYCLPVVGFDFSTLPPGAPPVYGYEAKWVWDRPEAPLAIFQCPARVAGGMYREIERTALDAYHALGCRDWCRVDVRIDRFGVPNILELNPLPGIIPDPAMNSCFPKAARAAGFGYDELIQEVVRIAWRRATGPDAPVRTVVGAPRAAPRHAAAASA